MLSKKQNSKNGFKVIMLAAILVVLGCVAPLLIIHYETYYPHWQPLLLEICGLGGLSLIFGRLLLDRLL